MTHSALPRIPARPFFTKTRIADIALALTYAATASLFIKSATLLERLGYHYMSPGGFPWEKTHPGTIVAAFALIARILAADDPRAEARRLLLTDRLLTLYFVTIAIAAAQAIFVTHYPFTGLIDTFFLPGMLLILMRDLDPRIRRSLALVACAIMTVNGCIGVAEYLTGWHLVPVVPSDFVMPDLTQTPDPNDVIILAALSDWRATALFGHPLENAFMSGALILCLASPGTRWLRPGFRFPLMALSLVAMVGFGGRTSLVLSVVGMVLYGMMAVARTLAAGAPIPRRGLAIALFAVPVVCALVLIVANAGFFDKLIMRFVDDAGSAEARIKMWDMFQPFTTTEILLGPDQDVVTLQQRLLGIELGIESFWVALTLYYGLIVAGLLFLGLGLLTVRVIQAGGPGTTAIMVYYFVNASTSTSLSSKTTTFGLVILLVILLLQKDRRSDILIPGVYETKPHDAGEKATKTGLLPARDKI